MLAGHVLSLLFDPYAQLRIFDLVLPFAGNYRPFWQGLGTLAFDLVLALIATSLLRHRLGARAWRAVHWLAYLSWPTALLHGLETGTDGGTWWLRTIAGLCAAVVAAALVWRLSPSFDRFPQRFTRRVRALQEVR
jgi:sulfoxide reductase heme-binding subunit YedZ